MRCADRGQGAVRGERSSLRRRVGRKSGAEDSEARIKQMEDERSQDIGVCQLTSAFEYVLSFRNVCRSVAIIAMMGKLNQRMCVTARDISRHMPCSQIRAWSSTRLVLVGDG